jgi:hypothetical protein
VSKLDLKPYRIARTGNADLDAAQESAREAIPYAPELTRGVMLECVVNSTPVAFAHKLGRKPVGWIIVDNKFALSYGVYRTAWDERTITLAAPLPADIKVWVF